MADLNPSKLGTREYWDDFYSLEHKNFEHDNNDTGECWFADSGAEDKMVDFLVGLSEEQLVDEEDATVLDLGTGNGRLLLSLRQDGYFQGEFLGIDYSKPAVEFAAQVAKAEKLDQGIKFTYADFLGNDDWNPTAKKWDIVLDKGTLDAIALSGLKFGDKTAVQQYMAQVEPLVSDLGLLLITSCNFTQQELIDAVQSSTKLKLFKIVSYPSFKFGGKEGSTICTVAFTF